jgi:mannose-1-phosphate guanylyltransferase
MYNNYFAVIMAGGGGTRLWPLSRKTRPKQMLCLIEESSLFQTTINRLLEIFPVDRILVVTVAEQAQELQKQCPDIPSENYLIEPLPRGTASVVGLASIALLKRDPDAVMAIQTSDHYISNQAGFEQLLYAAFDVAQQGYLVTLGIQPSFPATGYGYIQRGEEIGRYKDLYAYQAVRFKEKPTEEDARAMLISGDHAWNSGMFVWRADRIQKEIAVQMPALSKKMDFISASWESSHRGNRISEIWPHLKTETIDYGIMEGAERVAVIPAEGLGWSDIGSWDALYDLLPGDKNGNIIIGGEHFGVDSHDSLIYVGQEHRLIVTIGVNDHVIVDTGDVLLVCRKDLAQKVRQVVDELKKKGDTFL